ncbi:MAG: hypothetical protein KAW41_00440 [Candidatus Diapherotrites archaeon]|nr:hypothetical protein [Candidatus Diapherotrites archaeon]
MERGAIVLLLLPGTASAWSGGTHHALAAGACARLRCGCPEEMLDSPTTPTPPSAALPPPRPPGAECMSDSKSGCVRGKCVEWWEKVINDFFEILNQWF